MPRCAFPATMAARFIPLALAAAALLPVPAHATPARSLALSAGDFLEDDAAVFRWPGSARDLAGRLWLDSGLVDPAEGWAPPGVQPRTGPAVALAWTPGGDGPWTAGFALHARAADGDHAGLHRDGPGAGFTWLVGRALGPVDLAATWRSAYGGWSADADAADEFEHHRDDIGLGARFDVSPRAYVDVAVDRRHERNRMQAPGDPAAWDTGNLSSGRSWSARVRGFVALGPHAVLTPVGEHLREDYSGPIVGESWWPDSAMAHDGRLDRLGLAISWLPDPDRQFMLAAEHLDIRVSHTLVAGDGERLPRLDDVSTTSLRACAERRLNWWLSLRASLAWTRVTAESGSSEHYLDPAGGLALHLGVWGVDLAAGAAPLPEPWRWLSPDPGANLRLRATVHRDF